MKTTKKSAVDKIFDVLNELNQKIYNREKIVISRLIYKHNANHNLVMALKGRNLITPYGTGYNWTTGEMSVDTKTLRLYAGWLLEDVNEYQRKLIKKSKAKITSIEKPVEKKEVEVSITKPSVPSVSETSMSFNKPVTVFFEQASMHQVSTIEIHSSFVALFRAQGLGKTELARISRSSKKEGNIFFIKTEDQKIQISW